MQKYTDILVWFFLFFIFPIDLNTESPIGPDECLDNVTIPNTPINSFGIIECSSTSIAFETFADNACTTTAMGKYTMGVSSACQNYAHYSMILQC